MGNTKTQEVEWASEPVRDVDYSTRTFLFGELDTIRDETMRCEGSDRGSNIPEVVLYQGEVEVEVSTLRSQMILVMVVVDLRIVTVGMEWKEWFSFLLSIWNF